MMKKTVHPREIAARKVAPKFVQPKSIYAEEKSKSEPAPAPSPDDFWGLKLKMPEGGTVILRKNGNPNAVSLEVSTDGTNWEPWELVGTDYSYTLQAGETLCIRNTSETAVRLSSDFSNRYSFVLADDTYASGSIMSLMCNDESILDVSFTGQFGFLFQNCKLKTPPELPATILKNDCYQSIMNGTLITETPLLPASTVPRQAYKTAFANTPISVVRTMMTDITAYDCLFYWLNGVSATGDFYCPSSLTIPSGSSGIPNGWTRHDI